MPTFTPRLNSDGLLTLKYWGSQNPFTASGYGLPNCTCYCYGRWWEITGNPINTPMGDANTWYNTAPSLGLQTGQTPKLGAVACYYYANGGHVATVEVINRDGSIVTSNSAYGGALFFTDTSTQQNNYTPNWVHGYNGYFQGFIYLPGADLSGYQWYAKKYDGYDRNSPEAYSNAVMIYQVFSSLGFTLNAIAGILGNLEQESGYNPWQWEGNEIRTSTDYMNAPSNRCGYGLFQYTPCYDYIGQSQAMSYNTYAPNFYDIAGRPEDGDAQCRFTNYHAPQGQWFPSVIFPEYNLTWAQFKASTQTPEFLAQAWCWEYERPATQYANIPRRTEAARYWYDTLQNVDPSAPLPDPPEQPQTEHHKMPFWFYTLPPYNDIVF